MFIEFFSSFPSATWERGRNLSPLPPPFIFDSVTTLDEIEAAVETLPSAQQEKLYFSLSARLQGHAAFSANPPRLAHGVLDISPVSVEGILHPPLDDDLLGEMLEGRA
jgi:hypothetical protein